MRVARKKQIQAQLDKIDEARHALEDILADMGTEVRNPGSPDAIRAEGDCQAVDHLTVVLEDEVMDIMQEVLGSEQLERA